MSHLDDGVDATQLSVAELLQLLQDVDVTVNKQPARVSEVQTDVSVGTQQQDNASVDTQQQDNRSGSRESVDPQQDDQSTYRQSLDPMDGSQGSNDNDDMFDAKQWNRSARDVADMYRHPNGRRSTRYLEAL